VRHVCLAQERERNPERVCYAATDTDSGCFQGRLIVVGFEYNSLELVEISKMSSKEPITLEVFTDFV
tara:strand:+ start:158 stop:358 length:201 start_codon:yes stop_codon:yes gene_type:complete